MKGFVVRPYLLTLEVLGDRRAPGKWESRFRVKVYTLTDTSGLDPFCIARYVVGWEISLILMFIIILHRGMGSFTKLETQELNKI